MIVGEGLRQLQTLCRSITRRCSRDQYASAETTSPPARVEMACQMPRLTESFAKATCPSQKSDIHAPGMKAPGGLPARVVIDDAIGPDGIWRQVVII